MKTWASSPPIWQNLPATDLAVEGQADVVVAGASYAGCALALGLAKAGHSVILVEPRSYPGYETSALHRPWISLESLENPPELFDAWLNTSVRSIPGQSHAALKPDAVKRGLEDALITAGVRLLYASQPVGVVFEGKKLAGLVLAGKPGRRVLLARAVVDATEWALVARMAGNPASLRGILPARVKAQRTLEFMGVAPGLSDPEKGRWREGFLGAEHFLLEQEFELNLPSADHAGLMEAEVEARRQSFALVARLKSELPALKNAQFGQASYELAMLPPWLTGPSPFPNLSVLSAAAEKTDDAAWSWLDPMVSAQHGHDAVPALTKVLKTAPNPDPKKCLARCGTGQPAKDSDKIQACEMPSRNARGILVTVRAPAEAIPVLADVDVLVAGGGTAGAVAAPAAAERGASTFLAEMNSGLGGTGTLGGVNTYWYGRKEGFTAEVDRRYVAVANAVGATSAQTQRLAQLPAGGNWHVEAKMQALLEWSVEAGVMVGFRTSVCGGLLSGKALAGALVATPDGLRALRAKVTVESTGDGDLAAHAGAELQEGAKRDGMSMFCSLGPIPKPGHPTNSFAGWVDIAEPKDYTRSILAGRRRFVGYDHGPYLAPRESRHVAGSYTLTLQDHLTHRKHADVVCICHDGRDIKGLTSADWALWGLELGKVDAEIPLRAVVPKKLDGLLIGSKAYSCTHEGLSLARMQADMQNLGGAMGAAAAMACRLKIQPRKLNVKRLQTELIKAGALPASIQSRRIPKDLSPAAIAKLVNGLTGDELDYTDDYWKNEEPDAQPISLICQAGAKAMPAIKKAHQKAYGERRLLLARLMAWNGSKLGSDDILESIQKDMTGGKLPQLAPGRRPPPPDNAGMPRACRLMYTFSLSKEPRVLPLLNQVAMLLDGSHESLSTYGSGAFYYVQMACLVAEALGDPKALGALDMLHAKSGLHGLKSTAMQPGIPEERFGYLEVALARAMARCGSLKGARILVDYLDDSRAYLAAHAKSELETVTGQKLGWDQQAWLKHLSKLKSLKPTPWTIRGEA